ncbi:MAG: DUF1634 domain-containing protein [Thermoplasmata archaeon]|nr:DUF1634 domain-containing protein [Thermoplasmata archaeon]
MSDPVSELRPAVRLRRGRPEEEKLPSSLRGIVTRVLQTGVAATVVLLLVGLTLLFTLGPGTAIAARVGLSGLLHGLASADATAYLYLGVVVLLATPLVRVALSATLFAQSGDRPFAGITLFVLVLLVVSIVVGFVV